MTINEIVALVAVIVSLGGNIALYTHLSSTVNSRFDSSSRDIKELLRADLKVSRVELDARFDRLEGKLDRLADTMTAMLANHDQRLTTQENKAK